LPQALLGIVIAVAHTHTSGVPPDLSVGLFYSSACGTLRAEAP
jgi:hypothetical protein